MKIWLTVIAVLTLSFAPVLAQTTPDVPPPAQSSQSEQAPQIEPEIAEPQSSVETLQPADTTPKFNLDDPALSEALAAREAAEQAIVAAVLKAQKDNAAPEADAPAIAVETEAGPSLIDPENLQKVLQDWLQQIIAWLSSFPFLAQLGAIILVFFLSPIISKQLTKRIFLFRDTPTEETKFRLARDYIYRSREFLRAAIQVGLLALFAIILKNIPTFGQDWLVKLAQGLAVVFLLYRVIKTFVTNPLFQKLAIWIVIPLALLMVFGYYDDLINGLNNLKLGGGENAISAMTVIKLAIFGVIFFKLGNFSNSKGQEAIRSQEALDITTREVVAKIFQILVFGAVVIMALTAAGISLSGLVVIFSALSLGIGLGLQPIAANFVSGMIILFDRSVKVGDFVMMEDEKFGRVKAINMRSTTVATADGKDIIVPNTSFTEGAYENWTHDSPLQRYEVDFGVAYDTDLDALVPLIRDAVLEHPDVLGEPDLPSVEFRAFGDSSINMCVEFWCEGVDDGPNKFTSDVGFIVWRTLKANNIEIPFPQRVIKTLK